MGLTDINYTELLKQYLPARLQTESFLALVNSIAKEVGDGMYPKFKEDELRNWYDIVNSSGQVARLELVLNDRFDPVLKRIYIGPGIFPDRVYLYLDAEQQPLYVYKDIEANPVYLYLDNENLYGVADFTVFIPYGLPYEETTMRAVIDRYKRDSKSYKIIYF